MIHELYAIQDTKSQTFNPPFAQKNVGEAVRTFTKMVNDSQTVLNQFPEDFVLSRLGKYCDETGEIIPENMVIIGTASQYIKKYELPHHSV